MAEKRCDVVIIGAGPSGATAGALIKKAGFDVVVVEKQRFPRFVIGESLLPRCMDLLEEAGMLEAVESKNYLRKNGAVFQKNNHHRAFSFNEQFTPGWDYAYQVPRDDFDQVLVESAESQGVEILWEQTVTDVAFDDDGVTTTIESKSGEVSSLQSRFILDASGYGRVLPRLLDLEAPSSLPVRQSVFTHVTGDIRPAGDDEGNIWICVLPEENSWLWIIPFANGKTSVGLVAKPEFVESLAGETLDEKLKSAFLLEENARQRLANVEFCFPAVRIGGYSVAVKQFTGQHYALLGNASEFLDPVFSSGVTLALESANRAAKTLIRQFNGEQLDWDKEYTDYMSLGVEAFRTYVNAWYDNKLPTIFFSDTQPESLKKQICSVLAGYVWDADNPCVREHARAVKNMAAACAIMAKK